MSVALAVGRNRFTRRAFSLGAVVMAAPSAAGCFDRKPAHLRTFITFLQTRVIDRKGLRVPVLTKQEIAELGPYADQFRIISRFHHKLHGVLSGDLKRAVKAASPHSVEALSDLYAVIPEVKTAMTKKKLTLYDAEHEAAAARKALHQPADLKAVYDLAYEKLVDNPAHVMRQVPPKLETALTPLGTLAACLHAHRDAVSVLGNVIFPGDEAVRREVNALMENAARASRDIAETNRQLVSLAYGR